MSVLEDEHSAGLCDDWLWNCYLGRPIGLIVIAGVIAGIILGVAAGGLATNAFRGYLPVARSARTSPCAILILRIVVIGVRTIGDRIWDIGRDSNRNVSLIVVVVTAMVPQRRHGTTRQIAGWQEEVRAAVPQKWHCT